jgi:hypothetical protein
MTTNNTATINLTPTVTQGLLTAASASFAAFRGIQYGVITATSASFGAMLLPCLLASAGNVVGSIISLVAGVLADKGVISAKNAFRVTLAASILSLIITITALAILGAPIALAAASVILTLVTAGCNIFIAYKRKAMADEEQYEEIA